MIYPEVSVVMSVYNGAKYLNESVESILTQQDVNFEFIIVNDGSTDSSGDILSKYARQDSRVRIIAQENTGLTSALIRGCSEARGQFIARHDADDISYPERLKMQLSLIRSDPRYQFVSCWAKYIGPGGEMIDEIRLPFDPHEATEGLIYKKMGPPAHGSVMFRKDAYLRAGGYRKDFYYGQDSDLWLRFSLYGQVAYVPEFLYSFRLHAESISGVSRELQRQFGEIGQACHTARLKGESETEFLEKAAELQKQIILNSKEKNNKRSIAATYYLIGSLLQKQGDRRAVRYFWNTIKTTPYSYKAWIKLGNSFFL